MAFDRGEGLAVPLVGPRDRAVEQLSRLPGLGGALLLPLVDAGQVLGLAAFCPQPGPAHLDALSRQQVPLAALAAALATLIRRSAGAPPARKLAPSGHLRAIQDERDEAQRRFADIAAISADWIWETDPEDRFTYFSDSFFEHTGRTPARALGSSRWDVRDLYPEARASADWAWLEARIRDRLPFRDFVYKLPALQDGDRDVWIRTSGQPYYAANGTYRGYRGVSADISELKTVEARLHDIIEASGAGSFEVDLQTGRTTINDRWAAIVGLGRDEVEQSADTAWLRLMHPDDLAHALAEQDRCLSGEASSYLAEFRLRHAKGHWVSIVSHGRVTRRDPSGKALRLVGANFDITPLKEAQSRAERIIHAASVGTWEWDGRANRHRVNDVWAAMLGRDLAEVADFNGDQWHALIHPDDLPGVLEGYEDQLGRGQENLESVFRLRHRDGHWVWVLSRSQIAQRDADGRPIVISGIHIDITDAKRREADLLAANERLRKALNERDAAERQLRDFAMRDDLTGALNRRSFHSVLKDKLAAWASGGSEVCVAMIDLIRFKSVNETHGHGAGDRLLREVIRRWRFVEDRGAQVFRIGGDEFAVLMTGTDLPERITALIGEMRAALGAPFRLNSQPLRMEMSVGLAHAPRDGLTVDDLAANADLALFASKEEQGRTRVYTPGLRQSARMRHEIVQDLLASKVDRDFFLLYQPIVELATNRIAGVEALLRWNHPKRGPIGPGEFIEVLCGLDHSSTVGDWILRRACGQVAEWNRRFSAEMKLSVNVFPLQADNAQFPALVQAALAESGLSRAALEIEVTENIALREGSLAQEVLRGLTERGIAFSLDDFGTGYSSLKSLQQLKPRTLKVDRSFVDGVGPCDRRRVLLQSIRFLAQGLGVQTIVEGVETADVAREMVEIGFDYGQGFHWGRPVDAAQMGRLLAAQHGRG